MLLSRSKYKEESVKLRVCLHETDNAKDCGPEVMLPTGVTRGFTNHHHLHVLIARVVDMHQ